MIAHLRGKLISRRPNLVIVETGGVGYDVAVPLSTFYGLADAGSRETEHDHFSSRRI